jgi:hypothetical protein
MFRELFIQGISGSWESRPKKFLNSEKKSFGSKKKLCKFEKRTYVVFEKEKNPVRGVLF